MNIRRYQPSDWQGIIDITTEAFALVSIYSAVERAFGLLNGVSWQERKVAEVVAEIENNSGGVWVTEIAGEPVGFITTVVERRTRTGHIANMAVARDYRGQGIGKALRQAALDYFQAEGMMYSQTETLVGNEIGQAFYPQVGFQEVGRKIYYFIELADRHDRVSH